MKSLWENDGRSPNETPSHTPHKYPNSEPHNSPPKPKNAGPESNFAENTFRACCTCSSRVRCIPGSANMGIVSWPTPTTSPRTLRTARPRRTSRGGAKTQKTKPAHRETRETGTVAGAGVGGRKWAAASGNGRRRTEAGAGELERDPFSLSCFRASYLRSRRLGGHPKPTAKDRLAPVQFKCRILERHIDSRAVRGDALNRLQKIGLQSISNTVFQNR